MEFLAVVSIICLVVGVVLFNCYQRRRMKGVNKKTLDSFVACFSLIITGTTLAVISLGWFFMK